jgi:hypothetical protein
VNGISNGINELVKQLQRTKLTVSEFIAQFVDMYQTHLGSDPESVYRDDDGHTYGMYTYVTKC